MEVQSSTHSDKLSDKDQICELNTHNVKPDCLDKYLKTTENLIGRTTENPIGRRTTENLIGKTKDCGQNQFFRRKFSAVKEVSLRRNTNEVMYQSRVERNRYRETLTPFNFSFEQSFTMPA